LVVKVVALGLLIEQVAVAVPVAVAVVGAVRAAMA
jgi:hypothetical protein